MNDKKLKSERFENILQDGMNDLELKNEKFENISLVHDWRNYVDDVFRKYWTEFTDNERLIIYKMAEKQASDEEWN